MKLWILSDLHLSRKAASAGVIAPDAIPNADVTIIAGDICEGIEDAITWLATTIAPRMPVVYVVGNHEFYGEYIGQARRVARTQAARVPNLYLLDDADVVIDGVRFVGATLWTDYLLFAHGDQTTRRHAMRTIKERLSDHVQIWMDPVQPGFVARNFEPRDALALHEMSLAWLDSKLAESHPGRTVVVTHHAPHPRSIAQRWAGDALTPAFVSDLSSLMDRRQPDLWIHGHTHASFDYVVEPLQGGSTRVICNPRGYSETENADFDWRRVIEIGSR